MMRGDFGGNVDTALFRGAHQGHAAGRADVADMDMRAGHLGERNIARDLHLLGC